MGIIDTIKGFFVTRDSGKSVDVAIAAVKAAISSSNYNQASLKAFYALEKMGEVYVEIKREEHTTAREYAKQLEDAGVVTVEEVKPILDSFEIAKYSDQSVDLDTIQVVENTLNEVVRNVKSGGAKKSTKASRSGGKKRKPRKGGSTGKAKRRKKKAST